MLNQWVVVRWQASIHDLHHLSLQKSHWHPLSAHPPIIFALGSRTRPPACPHHLAVHQPPPKKRPTRRRLKYHLPSHNAASDGSEHESLFRKTLRTPSHPSWISSPRQPFRLQRWVPDPPTRRLSSPAKAFQEPGKNSMKAKSHSLPAAGRRGYRESALWTLWVTELDSTVCKRDVYTSNDGNLAKSSAL